jgi:transposase-like protein
VLEEGTMVHTPAATRWSKVIDEQEASGLSVRDFAAEHDVNPSTLAWWRSRLGRGRRPSEPVAQPASAPVFDELVVASAGQTLLVEGTVVIALERIEAHIVVDRETDLHLLRLVLDVLC